MSFNRMTERTWFNQILLAALTTLICTSSPIANAQSCTLAEDITLGNHKKDKTKKIKSMSEITKVRLLEVDDDSKKNYHCEPGMYYFDDNLFTSERHTLNLAVSTDGRAWRKHLDNPIPVHLTEERVISGVGAQAVAGRVHLWVTDEYAEVGGQAVGYYLFDPSELP